MSQVPEIWNDPNRPPARHWSQRMDTGWGDDDEIEDVEYDEPQRPHSFRQTFRESFNSGLQQGWNEAKENSTPEENLRLFKVLIACVVGFGGFVLVVVYWTAIVAFFVWLWQMFLSLMIAAFIFMCIGAGFRSRPRSRTTIIIHEDHD